jgi:predicted deacetylase
MVMGNPDFEKIAADDFRNYYKRSFLESYQYYNQENLKSLWWSGMEASLLQPQFHAREHFNVQLWMSDLQARNQDTHLGFKHHFFGLKTKTSSKFQSNYLAAYRAENKLELEVINSILIEGLQEFEQVFGFKSQSFIACNYVWPQELEKTLFVNGVETIQSQRGQVTPQLNKNGKPKTKYHYTGQRNELNQIYTVRNVLFEPFENIKIDWISKAMNEIENSFSWGKPAIVSTHRINYVSTMSVTHRDQNLKMLDELLTKILLKWPDVEFMSSDQLADILKK